MLEASAKSSLPCKREEPDRRCLGVAEPRKKGASLLKAEPQRKWQDHELPWFDTNKHIVSQSARLHNEIVELTSLLQPTEAEDQQRGQAKKLLQDVVNEIYPDATLEVRQHVHDVHVVCAWTVYISSKTCSKNDQCPDPCESVAPRNQQLV